MPTGSVVCTGAGNDITQSVQSLTITQQGFLNAIVYGWTREDFLHIMAINARRKRDSTNGRLQLLSSSESEEWDGEGEEDYDTPRQTTVGHARRLKQNAAKEEHSLNLTTSNEHSFNLTTSTDLSDND